MQAPARSQLSDVTQLLRRSDAQARVQVAVSLNTPAVGDGTGLVHVLSREDGSEMARLSTDGSAMWWSALGAAFCDATELASSGYWVSMLSMRRTASRSAGSRFSTISVLSRRVVTSAQFLLDSESNLAEVMRSMIGQGMPMQDMQGMPGMDMGGQPTDKGARVRP